MYGLDGSGDRSVAGTRRRMVARRFGIVGLIVVLSALAFGALLSGLQALKTML